jgi:amino acid permease
MLAYLIIGTDFILSWFSIGDIDLSSRWPRAGVVCAYGLLIPIALSIPKNLKILSRVSALAFICVIAYAIVMVVEVGLREKAGTVSSDLVIARMNLDVFASLAIYSLAFAMPVCVCPVICDSDPDVRVRNREVACALGIAFIITIVPSVCAYRIYGPECEGNIINSFPDDDWAILALRSVFFVVISLSYPAVHPPVACSWSSMFFKVNQAIDLSGWRRVVVLIVTNAIPLLIAMFLPDVTPALEIGGSIGGCLGNFAIPRLMWVVHSPEKKTSWKNLLAIAMVVFGVISGAISGWYAVSDAIAAFRSAS